MLKQLFIAALLLLAIASCTKKSVPTSSNGAKETALDGSSLFSQNCARCHGANGSGGRAPDLAHDDLTKNEVLDKATNGAGRMPSFATKLSAKEIDAVAEFVVHLKK
jgi:cytochrome c6